RRLPLDVGRDVIEKPGRFAGVVHGEDVGVIERRCDLDLAQKPLGPDRSAEIGSEHFHGYLAVVLQVQGEMDRGHSSLAQRALQAVAVGQRLGEALVLRVHSAPTPCTSNPISSRQLAYLDYITLLRTYHRIIN